MSDDRDDGRPYVSPRQSDDWLYRQIDSLRQLVTDQHARLRETMTEEFAEMRRQMHAHEAYDIETRSRVDRVVTQKEVEDQQAVKRTTWIAMIVSGGAAIVAEIIRRAGGGH